MLPLGKVRVGLGIRLGVIIRVGVRFVESWVGTLTLKHNPNEALPNPSSDGNSPQP